MRNRVQRSPPPLPNLHTCNINHRPLPSSPLKDTPIRRSNLLKRTTRASTILSHTLASQTCTNSTTSRPAKPQPWLPQLRPGSRVTAIQCRRLRWLDHHEWEVSRSKMSEHHGHHRRCRIRWVLCHRRLHKITGCPRATWDMRSAAHTARARKQ